ncbi:hypothetical protein QM480_01830 [Flectobacillus sp. DC10W]|uniref:Uncharacterized protein n=1 Tax=Flectobacillus longus TaxID=2984207 RepID=A0ABT6YI26_9BACT|nr:hypothetical protein [Flectobacillus longus]MDI9863049.1 hypothetical protein [Flectobacillus longus]
MKVYNTPISVLKLQKEYLQLGIDEDCKIIEIKPSVHGVNCLFMLKDAIEESDFYLKIYKGNESHFYLESKPFNTDHIYVKNDKIEKESYYELRSYILMWVSKIKRFREFSQNKDQVYETHLKYFTDKFTLVNVASNDSPYPLDRIIEIVEMIESIEILLESIEIDVDSKIQIKKECRVLIENISTATQKDTLKKIASIFARLLKVSYSTFRDVISKVEGIGIIKSLVLPSMTENEQKKLG